ncbi:MAG TPA: zinc ribbon domain-containing protein [Candidatus Anoxymicrobiaceae bacterium]
MEEHVCQSCGAPVKPEDYAEGSEKGDFCSFCMVHNEFAADRDQVKAKIAQTLVETRGLNKEQADAAAEEQMARLGRWQ